MKAIFPCLLLTFFLCSCSGIPVEDRDAVREKINQDAALALKELLDTQPLVQENLDKSIGYFVGEISSVQAAIIGGGTGIGVLHDTEKQTRTYVNADRFDLGPGLSATVNTVVILFYDREAMEEFGKGKTYTGIAAASSAGTSGGSAVSMIGHKADTYYLSQSGVAVTATARLVTTSVNTDLTDVGLSEISIPATRSASTTGEQGDDAPRQWNRALPFLAQEVIDRGYDLPLPYGLSLIYSKVDQEQYITDLNVGINGRPIEPFEFVTFDEAYSKSDSVQLKFDAWLFPFMNIFGMFGKVEGEAPLEISLDGNGMLDHLGRDCTKPGPKPLCNLLQDKTFNLPTITPDFSGETYGVGTILAAGWDDWFVTLPLTLTYADMEGKYTEGISTTVTPRVGHLFSLDNAGNLALYAGGNYLKTELDIEGVAQDPMGLFTFEYTVEQSNSDRWNALVGGNWNIDKRWSVQAEYNGFIGSRDAFIASLNFRY